jgi:hypothetical protein
MELLINLSDGLHRCLVEYGRIEGCDVETAICRCIKNTYIEWLVKGGPQIATSYRIPLKYSDAIKELAKQRFQTKSNLVRQLVYNAIAHWDELQPIEQHRDDIDAWAQCYAHIGDKARDRFRELCSGIGLNPSRVLTELLRRQLSTHGVL